MQMQMWLTCSNTTKNRTNTEQEQEQNTHLPYGAYLRLLDFIFGLFFPHALKRDSGVLDRRLKLPDPSLAAHILHQIPRASFIKRQYVLDAIFS